LDSSPRPVGRLPLSASLFAALALCLAIPSQGKFPPGWKIVQRPVGYSGDAKVALYFHGRYLVATSPGALYESGDGKNWQSVEMGDLTGMVLSARLKDRVAFVDSNDQVASSSNGTDRGSSVVGLSTDLARWKNLGTLPDDLYGVLVQDTQIVVVGGNGLIASYSLANTPIGVNHSPAEQRRPFRRAGSIVVPVPADVPSRELFGLDGRRFATIPARSGEIEVPRALLHGRMFLTFRGASSDHRETVLFLSLDR
jgi:hypothetical protein